MRVRIGRATVGLWVFAGACRDAVPQPDAMVSSLAVPAFTVGRTPTLALTDDGSESRSFSEASARRLPDGTIVVADEGSLTIRIFGRHGESLRTIAQRGGGPGELRGRFALRVHGDTILALGQPPYSRSDVLTYSSTRGYLAAVHVGPAIGSSGMAVDRLSTGELLIQRGGQSRIVDRPEPGRLMPDTITFGILTGASRGPEASVQWLPPVAGRPFYAYPWPNGPVPSAIAPYPFAGGTTLAVSGDRIWLVDVDSGRVRGLDGSGVEQVRVTLPIGRWPFDRSLLARREALELSRARRAVDTARVEMSYDRGLVPPVAPVADGAFGGVDGELWVRLFSVEAAKQTFLVLNRSGTVVGSATVPEGMTVQQVGRDFILVTKRDEAGMESILEFRLAR